MRTRRSISIASVLASRPSIRRWRRITSTICSPMVNAGLSEVIGSWKIIEMRLPRSSRIAWTGSASRSRPSNRISPPSTRPGGCGTNPMIESAVTLLPQPDSPTMPSVRPARTAKLTPSTAANSLPSIAKERAQVAHGENGLGFRGRFAQRSPERAAWKRAIDASISPRSITPDGRARLGRQASNAWIALEALFVQALAARRSDRRGRRHANRGTDSFPS